MEAILATQRPKESSYEAARQTTEEVLAEVKVGICGDRSDGINWGRFMGRC